MRTQLRIITLSLLSAGVWPLGALAAEVQINADTKIVRDGKTESVKSGAVIHVDQGQSFLAVPDSGVPVLVFLPSSPKSKITVSEADLKNAVDLEVKPKLEQATSEIINGLRKAENLMQHKDHEQALTITDGLKKKYPQISSVLFLSGTLHYLLNQRSAAVEDLESGLALDPKNESARKLLSALKSSSPTAPSARSAQ